ncbi:MAG: formyltransferase family protein [bacterium]|nr:formyltransferase family protein [bacterium]
MSDKLRIAMLISGGGTTMRSIITACKTGRLKRVEPVLVIASRADAGGITKAIQTGIPEKDVLIISRRDYPNSTAFGEAIIGACQERRIDLIGQYGWMIKTPDNVIKAYHKMMINQHPGPLDPGRLDFGGQGMYGMRVHCAVLYFARRIRRQFFAEATAQRVAVEFDKGAVLNIKTIPILETDDVISLQGKVLTQEHEVQIETLLDFSEDKVSEIICSEPLIKPGEETILEMAKEIANKLFPKG